jgi:PEP-CTERM motif
MNRTMMMGLAVAGTLALAPAAIAGPVYNSDPTAGWFFGHGNDHAPANSAVLTDGGDQIFLRMHHTFDPAPASVGNVYSFALGTDPVSFDWGITSDGGYDGVSASVTLTNIGTGASFNYDLFFPGNDNEWQGNSVENSNRLNWLPVGFDANVDDTYRVDLSVSGLGGDPQSLTVFAKLGDGAAGAVPEPASWAMMLGGFGLIGGAMRRRKTSLTFA